MNIGKYVLANPEKVDRAINGTVGAGGQPRGGVGPEAKPAAIIAEYDRLGGHIITADGGYKVKPGSFYDFKNKKAIAKPEPMLTFRIDGEDIEVDEGEPLPMEVRASQAAAKKKAEKAAAKKQEKADKAAAAKGKKGKGKKGKKAEADEEEDSEDATDKDDADGDGELA